MRSSLLVVALLGAFATALGCSSTTTSSGPSTNDGGTAAGDGSTTTGALTCTGVFECTEPCGDDDDACVNACVARATPPAKIAVDALVACVQAKACADGPCFQAKCPKELYACVDVNPTPTDPVVGTPPKGSIPSDLVGTWESFGELYEFKADGTATRGVEINLGGGGGGCKSHLFERGTAVVVGNELTIYYAEQVYNWCPNGSESPSEPYTPKSVKYTYLVETIDIGIKLSLTTPECPNADGYGCTHGYGKD